MIDSTTRARAILARLRVPLAMRDPRAAILAVLLDAGCPLLRPDLNEKARLSRATFTRALRVLQDLELVRDAGRDLATMCALFELHPNAHSVSTPGTSPSLPKLSLSVPSLRRASTLDGRDALPTEEDARASEAHRVSIASLAAELLDLVRAVKLALDAERTPAPKAEAPARARGGKLLRMRSPVVLWKPEDGPEAKRVDELLGELFELSNREYGAGFPIGKNRRDARFYPFTDVRAALADVLFKRARGFSFSSSPGALFWAACADPAWKHEEFAAANLDEILKRVEALSNRAHEPEQFERPAQSDEERERANLVRALETEERAGTLSDVGRRRLDSLRRKVS